MGIVQAQQTKPTIQGAVVSCNRALRTDSVVLAGKLQEFSAKGVQLTYKLKWFSIWQKKGVVVVESYQLEVPLFDGLHGSWRNRNHQGQMIW